MKLSTVTLWFNKLLNWLKWWERCQMKLLISKRKELREVGPQAQHIIFNNLRTLVFHPLHFPSKALFTLTWWDHARHKFCVQPVNGWCLCVKILVFFYTSKVTISSRNCGFELITRQHNSVLCRRKWLALYVQMVCWTMSMFMTSGLFSDNKSGGDTAVLCTCTPFPCCIHLNNTGIYWQKLAGVHISPILASQTDFRWLLN